MLSDDAIERFARQIVLPEVGGRGQERLLSSRVALEARSDDERTSETALLCALHLGVAGVGELVIDGRVRGEATSALAARNPGVRVLERADVADARVAIGDVPALGLTAFGGCGPDGVIAALPRARCLACLRAALPPLDPPQGWGPTVPTLLAPLLATAVLRELLGLAAATEPAIALVLGVERASAATRELPARPDCVDCARGSKLPTSGSTP